MHQIHSSPQNSLPNSLTSIPSSNTQDKDCLRSTPKIASPVEFSSQKLKTQYSSPFPVAHSESTKKTKDKLYQKKPTFQDLLALRTSNVNYSCPFYNSSLNTSANSSVNQSLHYLPSFHEKNEASFHLSEVTESKNPQQDSNYIQSSQQYISERPSHPFLDAGLIKENENPFVNKDGTHRTLELSKSFDYPAEKTRTTRIPGDFDSVIRKASGTDSLRTSHNTPYSDYNLTQPRNEVFEAEKGPFTNVELGEPKMRGSFQKNIPFETTYSKIYSHSNSVADNQYNQPQTLRNPSYEITSTEEGPLASDLTQKRLTNGLPQEKLVQDELFRRSEYSTFGTMEALDQLKNPRSQVLGNLSLGGMINAPEISKIDYSIPPLPRNTKKETPTQASEVKIPNYSSTKENGNRYSRIGTTNREEKFQRSPLIKTPRSKRKGSQILNSMSISEHLDNSDIQLDGLPNRQNLIKSINSTLVKSTIKEKLISLPKKLLIRISSEYSPTKIEIQQLLKEKYEDGSIYEGESRNGLRHGKGTIYYEDGMIFEGEFYNGSIDGYGTLFYEREKICYQGSYVDDKFEGRGILYNETPEEIRLPFNYRDFNTLDNFWLKYDGEFKGDAKNGKGTLYLMNGERFYGEFVDDNISGRGTFYVIDGHTIEGFWENNILKEVY